MNGDARSDPPRGASGEGDEAPNSPPPDAHEGPAGERDAAGEEIASSRDWGQHPINIRFSIRTFLSRYYVVVLAGPENRPKSRRQEERKRHPFATFNNLWLVGSLIALGLLFCGVLGLSLGAYFAFIALGP